MLAFFMKIRSQENDSIQLIEQMLPVRGGSIDGLHKNSSGLNQTNKKYLKNYSAQLLLIAGPQNCYGFRTRLHSNH